jgi:4-alpha-glucanotransferase
MGDLGPETLRFLDWAAEAGMRVWQVLPLTPTGAGHSPYSGPSAFGGDPLLLSPERLADAGWLRDRPRGSAVAASRVDFEKAARWKRRLLARARLGFADHASAEDREAFREFEEDPRQAPWLDDWCLFAALRDAFARRAWWHWPPELRDRRPDALRDAWRAHGNRVAETRFAQFAFERAERRGIEILGDLPFYVARDSADVWAVRELFQLDGEGRPLRVAGVPPDYFSDTGQLWGNPLYDWDRMAERGYDWWIARIRANLRRVHSLRLDHFRAFVAYWQVDATERTARDGRWVPGPGEPLFQALRESTESLPLVAEDLGDITPDVHAFRERLGLPGMRVLQFGFSGEDNLHHPSRHAADAVVYSGTHDNDTTLGWFRNLDGATRDRVLGELGTDDAGVGWRMIETAYDSLAELAVIPLQDLLGLGSEARMNRPGQKQGNWRWRAGRGSLTLALAARLRRLAEKTGRLRGS